MEQERNECFGDEFCRGFADAAPEEYDMEADKSSTPWFTPWHWADMADWFYEDLTPYEMGRQFAEKVYDQIVEAIEEAAKED